MYQNKIEYFAKTMKNNDDLNCCPPKGSANAIKLVLAETESAENKGKMIEF